MRRFPASFVPLSICTNWLKRTAEQARCFSLTWRLLEGVVDDITISLICIGFFLSEALAHHAEISLAFAAVVARFGPLDDFGAAMTDTNIQPSAPGIELLKFHGVSTLASNWLPCAGHFSRVL